MTAGFQTKIITQNLPKKTGARRKGRLEDG
jgi:hypothetical protein